MKLRLTTTILLLGLGAAGVNAELTAQERVARRVAEKYPVKVEEKLPYGISIMVIRGCEYFQWDTGYGKGLTHLGNCTNHGPLVVTNECKYCAWARSRPNIVTNECTRQHWPIPGQVTTNTVTNGIIHVDMLPLNPVKGQSYKVGKDPNTHTYLGGSCWSSTLLHWSESVNVEAGERVEK